MTEKAFEQMMSGLKQAKEEYRRTIFPDCSAKYYAVRDAIELLEKQEAQLVQNIGEQISCKSGSCPKCGKMLNTTCNNRYCGECGQVVKWE